MNMKNTATAAEVKKQFVIENIDEAVKGLVETMSRKLDYSTSAEVLDAALAGLNIEETAGHSMYDKLVWIARQCFLMGFADAVRTSAEAAQMGYTEIFQNE